VYQWLAHASAAHNASIAAHTTTSSVDQAAPAAFVEVAGRLLIDLSARSESADRILAYVKSLDVETAILTASSIRFLTYSNESQSCARISCASERKRAGRGCGGVHASMCAGCHNQESLGSEWGESADSDLSFNERLSEL
jgi:hypothetical protein